MTFGSQLASAHSIRLLPPVATAAATAATAATATAATATALNLNCHHLGRIFLNAIIILTAIDSC